MKKQIKHLSVALIVLSTLTLLPPTARAQGTAFMYQGQLASGGAPANGSFDMSFTLLNANSNGVVIAGPITNSATGVTNGLFTTTIDFGGGVFTGTNYWLQVAVRTNGNGAFVALSPFQAILPTPYAVYSANAGNAATAATATTATSAVTAGIAGSANSVSAANIVGTIQVTQLPVGVVINKQNGVTLGGTFSGNGSGLTNVALLSSNQTFTGVNFFTNYVVFGTPPPFSRSVQVRPAANRVLGIFAANGGGGSVSSGMTIESVNDANSANQPLEFRGSPNVFTTGNVAIGTTNTTERFEVDGTDATIRIRNLNDAVGGFIGNTYTSLQLGMYNPSASTQGVLSAGVKRSFFGFDQSGKVGSLINNFYSFSYRNLLDDGSGNMTIAGVITGNGAGLTNLNLTGPSLFSASGNAAVGYQALASNTTGINNTANGAYALVSNTNGYNNTANGNAALRYNISGYKNTAEGGFALQFNTIGFQNTAVGGDVLNDNTTGYNNTACGQGALFNNTNGSQNTANGEAALYDNTSGNYNTANGAQALFNNTAGSYNIGFGFQAGNNITTGSSNIDIGNPGVSTDTSIIRIGSGQTQTFIAGQIVGDGSGLTNLNVGQLSSSALTNNENGVTLGGAFNGDGGGLTNLNAANLTGTAGNLSVGSITVNSNLYLPTTTATAGSIYSGSNTIMHANGSQNFFAGLGAGNFTMSGTANTANGWHALLYDTSGFWNTASGAAALQQNTTGANNTANGVNALLLNTNGSYNTANGVNALYSNTSGSNNIALGYQAGYNITTGSSNIDIGNLGLTTDTNIIRIGTAQTATYLAGTVYANGVALTSDRNAKENFATLDSQSVLAKVAALPLMEWNYKDTSAMVRHVGPMAQDFHAAFQLNGTDDKHISVVDESGVALAAIQGLNQKLNARDAEIQELKQSVAELKKMVQSLAEKK